MPNANPIGPTEVILIVTASVVGMSGAWLLSTMPSRDELPSIHNKEKKVAAAGGARRTRRAYRMRRANGTRRS